MSTCANYVWAVRCDADDDAIGAPLLRVVKFDLQLSIRSRTPLHRAYLPKILVSV